MVLARAKGMIDVTDVETDFRRRGRIRQVNWNSQQADLRAQRSQPADPPTDSVDRGTVHNEENTPYESSVKNVELAYKQWVKPINRKDPTRIVGVVWLLDAAETVSKP